MPAPAPAARRCALQRRASSAYPSVAPCLHYRCRGEHSDVLPVVASRDDALDRPALVVGLHRLVADVVLAQPQLVLRLHALAHVGRCHTAHLWAVVDDRAVFGAHLRRLAAGRALPIDVQLDHLTAGPPPTTAYCFL